MLHRLSSSPRQDGYFMPAEWADHARTWMLWPSREDNWRQHAEPAQHAFADAANTISTFEPVFVGVNPDLVESARTLLKPNVQIVPLSSNDAWMRDCGPTFVVDSSGNLRTVNWMFNAWGGLYADWSLDEVIPIRIAENLGVDFYDAPLVLEGGSIHVDGEGTLLTTEECLLNPNRNPHLNRNEIEMYLRDYTGAATIIWLAKGIYHDETSGHIDNIACFLRPGVVAISWTDDHNDPQYPISLDAYQRLVCSKDARGRYLEVLKIHQPDPVYITHDEAEGVLPVQGTYPRNAGDRMAASYINFYFCNGAAIVPIFHDPHDRTALQTLQNFLPERNVIGIPTREILLGGGNIHCITQQQPASILNSNRGMN